MTGAAEDFGNALDAASQKNGRGDSGAAAAAAEAYQPNASNEIKQKDTEALNKSLVDSGLIPGLQITGVEGTETIANNGHKVITVDIGADNAAAGLGDDPKNHHQAIYDETTHELTWTRNSTLQGNNGQEETVHVNMLTGQETVNWGDRSNMTVVIRAHTGDQAYTYATVKDGVTSTQSFGADGQPGEERHGNTTVKRDSQGNIKEYDNGNYTLSKHDDGKWYYHENGDGHKFVEVDGGSIKMDDKGKVTFNERGLMGNDNQTLGNGSTGGLNDLTHAVSGVANDVAQTVGDVWNHPTKIGAIWNDITHTASDAAHGASTLASDAVHTAADLDRNLMLGVEGYGQGIVNGAIDTFNHFAQEAHEGWGLPSLHINDMALPNQAEVDNSWGGKAGHFIGGLGSKLTQAVGDMAVDLGKATYNFDKMMVNDATTLVNDALNDPSKLGGDLLNIGQQVVDFDRGVVEGLVIKPVNGVIGGVDHALNWVTDSHDFTNAFKLGNIVSEEYERTHAAARMGDVVGDVALQVGLAIATDGASEAVIGAGRGLISAGARALGRGSRVAKGAEEGAAGLVPKGELPKQPVTKPEELPKTPPSGAPAHPLETVQTGDPVPRLQTPAQVRRYDGYDIPLTPQEHDALLLMKGDRGYEINAYLRAEHPLSGGIQSSVEALDSAMARAPAFETPTTLFRGQPFGDSLEEAERAVAAGKVDVDLGYRSTSASPKIADDFARGQGLVFEYEVPAGVRAIKQPPFIPKWDGDGVSLRDEAEYLFPRGSQWRYTDASVNNKGQVVIKAQYVSPP